MTIIKRTVVLLLVGQFLGLSLIISITHAQTASAGSAIIASPIVPPTPIAPPVDSGFIQFNNLTVENVSGNNPPAEILAGSQNIYPMVGAAVPTSASSPTCYKFSGQNSASSQKISCPTPPSTPQPAAVIAPGAGTGNVASPTMYSQTYPIIYQPYRIEVDASTNLILRDRTVATLSSFSAGDQINVFGYYNSDGSVQAYLIRDLSKPAQDEFLQLNNVNLISVSTGTVPVTLVVAQSQGYPCYGFGINGAMKQSIACPMGVSAITNNIALRKSVITIDAQTVLLNSNRGVISISDLQAGDSLNIYGDTTDNGQTLTADIVRDLSIPATPSTYSGTVTQVNTDGSFVVQTQSGQVITVPNTVQVGETIQLTGLLNRLTNILSQVSNIYFGGSGVVVIPPVVSGGVLKVTN